MYRRTLALLILGYASQVQAALSDVGTFCSTFPTQCQRGTISELAARGSGTNTMYIMEVDPTTGALPVSASFTPTYAGATGAAVPANASYSGYNNGGTLIGGIADSSGRQIMAGAGTAGTPAGGVVSVQGVASGTTLPVTLQAGTAIAGKVGIDQTTPGTTNAVAATNLPPTADTNFGTPGASTLRSACMLGAGATALSVSNPAWVEKTNGTTADAYGTGADGATVPRVTLSTRAESQSTPLACALGNGSALVAFGTGADGATVLRTTESTRHEAAATPLSFEKSNGTSFDAYGSGIVGTTVPRVEVAGRDSTLTVVANNSYASTSVTTAAYVQLIASTANATNTVCFGDTSGSIMQVATGAAASEVVRFYVPAGGSGCYAINIPASTRISLKALDATASTGYFLYTAY